MKLRTFLLASAFLMVNTCAESNAQIATSTPVPRGPDVHAVFAGVTPCSAQAKPLPQIPADSDCEQMIWNIIFYQDPQTSDPTTYRLQSAYGLPKQNTNDLVNGGTPISMEGKWTIATGTKSDPDAVVYQLDPDDPQKSVSFLRVSENLLHVLSRENTLLVGNGAWSYTLNRMDNQHAAPIDAEQAPDLPTRPPLPPAPEGSSVFGIFDGRTPCHEVVVEFTQITPFPGCMKIKWRLTLYQDSSTGDPSTYLYFGTSTIREGTWQVMHGMDGDPDAVVYELQFNEGQPPLSFLRVDENHLYLMDASMKLLVGDELFSYTLSRADPATP